MDLFNAAQKELAILKAKLSSVEFSQSLDNPVVIEDVNLVTAKLESADNNTLRQMADQFRQKYPNKGVAVISTVVENRPILVATVTEDLVSRGLHAGNLVKFVANQVGGGGGGRPTLAQAGGKDANNLSNALNSVSNWVRTQLK